jgi:hypothetical protein
MADEPKSLGQRFWIGFQKCFRGLIAEEKGDHGWELSLQRVSFWVILAHCLTVWNKLDHLATGVATKMDVSDGELYTLWALLGYGGVKIGAEASKSMMATWKGETKDAG